MSLGFNSIYHLLWRVKRTEIDLSSGFLGINKTIIGRKTIGRSESNTLNDFCLRRLLYGWHKVRVDSKRGPDDCQCGEGHLFFLTVLYFLLNFFL